jgi:hypothetical protein
MIRRSASGVRSIRDCCAWFRKGGHSAEEGYSNEPCLGRKALVIGTSLPADAWNALIGREGSYRPLPNQLDLARVYRAEWRGTGHLEDDP